MGGFPRARRPKQCKNPAELTQVMAAIDAFRQGIDGNEHPFRMPVADEREGRAARKRMWRMAKAEGYRLKTQVAQPIPGMKFEVIYAVTAVIPHQEGTK